MGVDKASSLRRAANDAARASGQRIHFDRYHRHNEVLGAARFVLDNGLTILYAQDFRAPLFAYQTWFKVGSKHEDPNRTGLAHLLEHLMFKGTSRHAPGKLDRELERRGSQTNAATWVDWTYYHEALATRGDNLATVIDFEADRMRGLVLDEQTFVSELEVVKNERRLVVDDSVTGSINETLYELAFTTHPYRWPTIGAMAHLEAVTLADLTRFYRAYYAPNNAVVVVAGALEPLPTLTALAEAYGPLAAEAVPPAAWAQEPPQSTPRAQMIRRAVLSPQCCLGFHAPAQPDGDFMALQLLSQALVVGDDARLYRRLVTEEQLAVHVEGALMPFAEPGLYEISITLRDGASPRALLAAVRHELDELSAKITEEEEEKAHNGLELELLEGQRSAVGVAENLGHHEVSVGDFSMAFRSAERLGEVTRRKLARVAAEVFRAHNQSVVIATAEDAIDV